MRHLGRAIVLSAAVAGAIVACGSARLPAPPYVGQATEALQPAEYPPPPARVEFIPSSPRGDAVWLDGEWTWQGRRWAWKRGRWVVPPNNARYAPWTTVRDALGTYYVAEGRWRDDQGRDVPDPPALVVGRPRAGAVVNPEGEEIAPTPNVQPDAPRSGASDRRSEAGAPEAPSGATPTGTEPKGDGGRLPERGSPLEAGAPEESVRDAAAPTDAVPPSASSPRMERP